MAGDSYRSDSRENAESLTAMARRVYNDMYLGNGKPGMTTRMDRMEVAMVEVQQQCRTLGRMFWAIIILLVTILGSIITEFVARVHG
jgi:hypothetical protein